MFGSLLIIKSLHKINLLRNCWQWSHLNWVPNFMFTSWATVEKIWRIFNFSLICPKLLYIQHHYLLGDNKNHTLFKVSLFLFTETCQFHTQFSEDFFRQPYNLDTYIWTDIYLELGKLNFCRKLSHTADQLSWENTIKKILNNAIIKLN